jgi:glycosyltransferase involved in cell wall biosynthesis
MISVILPCRNEEETIRVCIEKIKRALKGKKYEIIVSDSSSDRSAEIATELQVKVIKHNKEGYGNAYLEGFKHAKGDIIVMGDSDNTYDFGEIPKLLNYINDYDLVLGERKFIERGAMSFSHRYIGNPVLSFISRLFFKTKIRDINTGFRIIKKESLDKLYLQTSGMEFASEMIVKAIKKKLRIKEVPISYYRRKGKSKLNSFRDGWRHLRFMLLYSPLFLFFVPGIIFLLLSTFFLFSNILFAALLMIIGYQLIIFSLFTKTYAVNYLGDEPILDSLYKYVTIERASLTGLLIILFGIFLYFLIGTHKTESAMLAFIFIVFGIQIIFSSFMLSILGIKHENRNLP